MLKKLKNKYFCFSLNVIWNFTHKNASVCFSCVFPVGPCPMSSSPTVWCVMAPVLSGVWWGPEAGVAGSGTEASTGVASWPGSGQLILVVTLSILTALLLVSVLLLLCASCQGWARHSHTNKHTRISCVRVLLSCITVITIAAHSCILNVSQSKLPGFLHQHILLCQLTKANLPWWEMQTVHKYLRGHSWAQ